MAKVVRKIYKRIPGKKGLKYYLFRYTITTITVFFIFSIASFITKQTALPSCANSISCTKDLSTRIENNTPGIFEGHKVIPPIIDLNEDKTSPMVLGDATSADPKHIYVDLTHQTLYAYQGNKLVLKTFVSTGKYFPTPEGDYKIWIKLRATRMSGGTGSGYYNLPNVPYTMFFYNNEISKSRGFSLHGAYWHNNFGYPMSHGCVNMRIIDAKAIYEFVNPETKGNITYATDEDPGTPVTIFGTTPEF